jgi:hypothetical protein
MPSVPTTRVAIEGRHTERAAEAGRLGAGTRDAARVGLEVAERDRLGRGRGLAGNAFAERNAPARGQHGLRDSRARSDQMEMLVVSEPMQRPHQRTESPLDDRERAGEAGVIRSVARRAQVPFEIVVHAEWLARFIHAAAEASRLGSRHPTLQRECEAERHDADEREHRVARHP